jgi:hypothetical protein
MTDLDDFLAAELHDESFRSLTPGSAFTQRLAETVVHVLDTYPTKAHSHRQRMHALATGRYPTWEQTARRYVEMVS